MLGFNSIPAVTVVKPNFGGCQVSDSASAAGVSFTEHMSQVEIRPQRVVALPCKT